MKKTKGWVVIDENDYPCRIRLQKTKGISVESSIVAIHATRKIAKEYLDITHGNRVIHITVIEAINTRKTT